MSGASDQLRVHRDQSHASGALQSHRPSRMASQTFARPEDATPTAPIAIARSSVTSLRDDISSVTSLRLGSRFGDPLGDNAPPIVSTPPVRRTSLSHDFHSDPAVCPPGEIPPRSPSPYEREEVVVRNPQYPPVAQPIHQRLATRNTPSDPTPRRKERPTESISNPATAVEVVRNPSFSTPLHEHVTADSLLASEPSSDRRTPVPEATSTVGSQGSMTAGHQAKASPPVSTDSRPPPRPQSHSSPQSGVQSELSPGSAHTKAKFVSIFDSVGSKHSTPTGSKSAAVQVAQGVHPPSLLNPDVTGCAESRAASSSESTSLRGPLPHSSTSESVSGRISGARQAPKSDQRQGSTATPPIIIPNFIPRSHEQKLISPSSTVQEGSTQSGSSSLPNQAVSLSEAGNMPSAHKVLCPPREPVCAQVPLSEHFQSPSGTTPTPPQHTSRRQQEVAAPLQRQEQREMRTEDPPKKSQPMLRLVPRPGYGSNVGVIFVISQTVLWYQAICLQEPSPITFPVTATAASLERQVMQERERILRESSVSNADKMVPIEYCPPPMHQVITRKTYQPSWQLIALRPC